MGDKKHADLKKAALNRPGVKAEYEAIKSEFEEEEQLRELRQINANLVAAVNSIMSIDAKLEMWMDEQMHEPENDVLNPRDTL